MPPDLTTLDPQAVAALPAEAVPAAVAAVAAEQARLAAVQAALAARLAAAPADGPPPVAYTLAEAAALLHKSPAWVRRRAVAGRVPGARKVGRSWQFARSLFDRARERGMGA